MANRGEPTETRPTRWDPWRDLSPYGRWDPFRGLSLMEEFFTPGMRQAAALSPAIDVDEDEERYTIQVELAGVRKEDIHLEVEQNVLHIRGEKRVEEEEAGKRRKRRWTERVFGAFQRSFSLPSDSDPEHLEASFRDGVLRIDVPKSEAAKPRTITVK